MVYIDIGDIVFLFVKKFELLVLLNSWDFTIIHPQILTEGPTSCLQFILLMKTWHLKTKFNIENIPIENHRLIDMYWLPKMHKNPINV